MHGVSEIARQSAAVNESEINNAYNVYKEDRDETRFDSFRAMHSPRLIVGSISLDLELIPSNLAHADCAWRNVPSLPFYLHLVDETTSLRTSDRCVT